jgi:transcriptional regulator of acetoin/glycerol metabolism
LRALKEVFPVRRAALLEALERFGFDFYDLLKKDFELGHSDAQIGWRHGVDAKWIQAQRRRLGFPTHMGRPSKHPKDEELAKAFREAGRNYSEAARRLGMDRATFTKRYNEMRERKRWKT